MGGTGTGGRTAGGRRDAGGAPQALRVIAALRKEEPGPLYFLHGEEPFLLGQALNALRERVFLEGGREFNLDEWRGNELDGEKAVAVARTCPMFGRRRMVVLRDVTLASDAKLAPLVPYVGSPAPECCLVATAGRLDDRDRRRPLVAALLEVARVHEFRTLWQNQVADWLAALAREKGVVLEDDAADFLAEAVGNDLAALDDALERLCLYVGKAGRITLADVEECIADTRTHTLLDLGEALGGRDLKAALLVLGKLQRGGAEEPLRLLAMLVRRIRDYWRIREVLADGGDLEAVKAVVGSRSDWYCRKLVEQARRFGSEDFLAAATAFHEADVRLKSVRLPGRVNEWIVLEDLVRRLCRPSGPG